MIKVCMFDSHQAQLFLEAHLVLDDPVHPVNKHKFKDFTVFVDTSFKYKNLKRRNVPTIAPGSPASPGIP